MTNDFTTYNFPELDSLSEKERQYAIEILKEYSKRGTSAKLDRLIYEDYEEIPVTIEEFLYKPEYLGNGLIDAEGRMTVFPYWIEMLKIMYPDPLQPASYRTLALTGSIGIGKSFIAVICILYDLYRMLCLKDPYLHYGLQPIDKITFAFFNITLDAAKGVAWDKCQQLLQSSEWFMKRGRLSKSDTPIWSPHKGIELICGSQSRHIIGRAVFDAFIDEVSFQIHSDVEKQKKKAAALVNTAAARMQSRFMKGEQNPTLLILASSKRTDSSFMESFIDNKRKNESKTTYIVDEPQWVIRTDKDSPFKFKVAVGNKFLNSELLPLSVTENELQIYRSRGFTIMDVPMGYYENFRDDIDVALMDIAGISTTNAFKFISGVRWSETVSEQWKNPFKKEVLEVGNGSNDTTQYYDFFDDSAVPADLRSKPLFIHLDMSLSGDRTGIAGVWIVGKTPHQDGVPDAKELYFKLAFAVAIKAPKGHEIAFEKNRQFIRWLRQKGYAIKGVSSDTFQSADLRQTLSSEGYSYSTISVDRVNNGVCEPYQYFRSTIYEKRIETFITKELTEEIVNLERDGSGKVNHPLGGTVGSKDIADAVAGATWNASLHAEEFAFDYGETLDTIKQVSQTHNYATEREQISVDFQNELNKMFNPLQSVQSNNSADKSLMDFGMGKAQPLPAQYLANGIIVI